MLSSSPPTDPVGIVLNCSFSLLLSSPVKRAREEHEATGSGTEPQKKKQKEKKDEQDGSSPSAHYHR